MQLANDDFCSVLEFTGVAMRMGKRPPPMILRTLDDDPAAEAEIAEFHPIDFKEGFVLVGHDGPHHLNIANGRPVLRSLLKYHGKPGQGASVEFKIKEGPITISPSGSAITPRPSRRLPTCSACSPSLWTKPQQGQ